MKICKGCGESLPLSMFGKEPRVKSGMTARCLTCMRQRNKRWRESENGRELRRAAYIRNNKPYKSDEGVLRKKQKANKKMIADLPDYYVANALDMRVSEAPQELLDLKRAQLASVRLWKELHRSIKELENANGD